jgi:hypothetical protein
MIPDSVFFWVSFFLLQRPLSASFLLPRRCHSTWRNAPFPDQLSSVLSALGRKSKFLQYHLYGPQPANFWAMAIAPLR